MLFVLGFFSYVDLNFMGELTNGSYSSKRYNCACGKSYSLYRNLQRHMVYECGKAPKFGCSFCHMSFKRKYSLVNHIKLQHGHE